MSGQNQPPQQPGPVYKPQTPSQYHPQNQPTVVQVQKSVEYDPRIGSFENSKEVQSVGVEGQSFKVQKVDKSPKVEKPSPTTPKTTLEQVSLLCLYISVPLGEREWLGWSNYFQNIVDLS